MFYENIFVINVRMLTILEHCICKVYNLETAHSMETWKQNAYASNSYCCHFRFPDSPYRSFCCKKIENYVNASLLPWMVKIILSPLCSPEFNNEMYILVFNALKTPSVDKS
jgi:hypothetical protein